MVRIVVSILLLLVLAVLVVFNVDYKTTVNLFGLELENISVIAVGIFSFVAGALYSFFIYVASYLRKRRRKKLGVREEGLRERETEIAHRGETADASKNEGGGKFLGLFGGKKSDNSKQSKKKSKKQIDNKKTEAGKPAGENTGSPQEETTN